MPPPMKEKRTVSAAEELHKFRRDREGQLIIRGGAPLLIVSLGQKYSGPHLTEYKLEGKYHIPVNYKAILKLGDGEVVVVTRQGSYGPEFRLEYFSKSSNDDSISFGWNSNITQLWDQLLTALDEDVEKNMKVSVRGPWHIFGFTEDAVQLELDRVMRKDNTSKHIDGMLYCQHSEKPSLEDYQRCLGLEPRADEQLVWIANEFMNESLPVNFHQFIDAGRVHWVNTTTQKETRIHPHYEKYSKMLNAARLQRPLPHWRTIMSFQIEFLFCELFNLNGHGESDFNVPIETVTNVIELARIFKVDIKEEPYLVHVLKRALRHYASVVRSKQVVAGVEEFRNLMQRYRDVVKQFEKAQELEGEQVAALRQCVECREDSKEPAVIYCDDCEDMLCQPCFDKLHSKGQRQFHKRTWVELGVCTDCESSLAQLHCVQCQDAFCYSCFEQIHVRGGRRTHVPIVLRSFSLSKHTIPASSAFAFGSISPTAVTIGSNAARNLAISMSPWLSFEDENEIKVYHNIKTGEHQRDLPMAPINTSIESNIGGGFAYGWAESLTCI